MASNQSSNNGGQLSRAQEKLRNLTGLRVGDCIEVYWKIERTEDDSDEATEESKWWAAYVEHESPPPAPVKAGEVPWKLRYTAYGEFEEDVVPVVFLSKHTLRDEEGEEGDGGDLFTWRTQGSTWTGEETEEAAESMDATTFGGDRIFTSSELMEVLSTQIRQATGAETEDEAMTQISNNVDANRLRQGAAGYRDFIEKFKEHLAGVAAAEGVPEGGLLVTPDIVADFTRSLKNA